MLGGLNCGCQACFLVLQRIMQSLMKLSDASCLDKYGPKVVLTFIEVIIIQMSPDKSMSKGMHRHMREENEGVYMFLFLVGISTFRESLSSPVHPKTSYNAQIFHIPYTIFRYCMTCLYMENISECSDKNMFASQPIETHTPPPTGIPCRA